MNIVRTLGRRASFLGGGRSRRAHPLDECGTLDDLPAIRPEVEFDPQGSLSHFLPRRGLHYWRVA